MEFLPNGTLGDMNRQFYVGSEPPEWDATARSKALLGLVAGMAFIHSLNVIHRDLKPENILLDEDYEVRISGYARARVIAEEMSEAPGTVLTQAPETYSSSDYTPKVDVFSFAVCLYLMWCNAIALDDKPNLRKLQSAGAVKNRIQKGARFVKEDNIPESHWRLITRCWNQEPVQRPSFAEILRELRSTRDWVVEGTDEGLLAEYEEKVLKDLNLD
jgi:serine/threonine protein kinase